MAIILHDGIMKLESKAIHFELVYKVQEKCKICKYPFYGVDEE